MEEEEQEMNYTRFEFDSEIRKYYKSCINDGSVSNTQFHSLKETLSKLGGWPVLEGDRWKGENSSLQWYDMVLKMQSIGFYKHSLSIISYYIGDDIRNKGEKVLYLNLPPRNMFLKQTSTLWDNIVNLAIEFGASSDIALRDMNETRMFELELTNAIDNLTAHRQLQGPLVITEGSRIFDDGILRVILSLIKSTSMITTLGNVITSITNHA